MDEVPIYNRNTLELCWCVMHFWVVINQVNIGLGHEISCEVRSVCANVVCANDCSVQMQSMIGWNINSIESKQN